MLACEPPSAAPMSAAPTNPATASTDADMTPSHRRRRSTAKDLLIVLPAGVAIRGARSEGRAAAAMSGLARREEQYLPPMALRCGGETIPLDPPAPMHRQHSRESTWDATRFRPARRGAMRATAARRTSTPSPPSPQSSSPAAARPRRPRRTNRRRPGPVDSAADVPVPASSWSRPRNRVRGDHGAGRRAPSSQSTYTHRRREPKR